MTFREKQTKVVDLDGWHISDVPLDKEINVRKNDERRSKGRPRVVLNDQVVALKLPVDVAVCLNLRESVAKENRMESSEVSILSVRPKLKKTHRLSSYLPEHGNEQVNQ